MRRLGALAAAYGAAVAFLTWPLLRHAGTDLPATTVGCRFDSVAATWILAHVSRWLASFAAFPLGDANIYHPAPGALFYGPTCLAALPFFTPVFLSTGNPTLAINAVFLGGVTTTAVAVHWVAWRWTRSDLAGGVAAASLLTTPWVLWEWIPGAPWFATLWAFPLVIALAARSPRRPGDGLLMAVLVAVLCATDPVYVAPAVVAPLGAIGLVRLLRRSTRGDGARLLGALALGGGVFLAAHAGQLALALGTDLTRQTMWWFPVTRAALPEDLRDALSPMALPVVGWALAVAAAGAALRRRAQEDAVRAHVTRHALWWAVAGLLLSITPVVLLFGYPVHVRPLEWLEQWVPIHERLRNPIRMRVAGLFGLALLAGLGFDRCARAIRRAAADARAGNRRAAALAAAVVFGSYLEYRSGLPRAYPIAPAPTLAPDVLRVLEQPGGPLLEVPFEGPVVIFPPSHARAMYRSIAHGRRLLNGYLSYYPAGFFERMTVAARLPDADALATLVAETGLELVLVHVSELGTDARARWLAIADGTEPSRLRVVVRQGGTLLFRVGGLATQAAGSDAAAVAPSP